ncbi:Kazal-type serine protease inhibitor domain-containing protein [uncultured Bradyrhizobium sp.]|uniref:Kazal-type serine protease inhibitor domain-containing protein n=1 Tax=uncultured Bradyrhizobium sp. TaxID=199684 RepID=UPI00263108AB|nr:Kazal-type serine protease inhibitor domain-containing protein [uncultured Bradyrhizobium sp.]
MKRSLALASLIMAAVLGVCVQGLAQPRSDQPPARSCGGVAGLTCPAGQYCSISPPQHPDKMGVCRPKPEICNMLYQPVCGVNHHTYPNACSAAAAGINVTHAGKCELEMEPRKADTPHA